MKNILIIVVLSLFTHLLYGQSEKVQAMFIYNFTKYVEWPASSQTGNFTICVLGNSPIYEELIKIAEVKSAGSQPIVVKRVKSVTEVSNQHILFISNNKSKESQSALSQITSNPTLIITETDGMLKNGSAINFIMVDNKQRFEIKKENITNKGLTISSELEKFAISK